MGNIDFIAHLNAGDAGKADRDSSILQHSHHVIGAVRESDIPNAQDVPGAAKCRVGSSPNGTFCAASRCGRIGRCGVGRSFGYQEIVAIGFHTNQNVGLLGFLVEGDFRTTETEVKPPTGVSIGQVSLGGLVVRKLSVQLVFIRRCRYSPSCLEILSFARCIGG